MHQIHFEEVSALVSECVDVIRITSNVPRRKKINSLHSFVFPYDDNRSIEYYVEVHISKKDYSYSVVDSEFHSMDYYLNLMSTKNK